jgi:prolyl 4-hydroxylase
VAAPPTRKPPADDKRNEQEDDAVLKELAKKCKTLDHTTAEIIDPADYEEGYVHELDTDMSISIVPKFLTDKEIAHLLSLADGTYGPSLVMTAGVQGDIKNMEPRETTLRTSWSTLIDFKQTPIVQEIERRLSLLAGIDVNYLERLAMVKYKPGQQYKIHHDGIWRPTTVFIYLNDVDEDDDGETYFPNLDIKIRPRKGTAIMWPNTDGKKEYEDNRAMHAGLPPKRGTKYGVNCFFNAYPKRLMNDGDGVFRGQGPPESIRVLPQGESIKEAPLLSSSARALPTSPAPRRNMAVSPPASFASALALPVQASPQIMSSQTYALGLKQHVLRSK